jgi:hypothetical protein
MKRVVARSILLFILSLSFILSSVGIAFANNTSNQDTFDIEKKYGEMFLSQMGHASSISNPIKLNNMDNKLEAVRFKIDEGGYIIVNINDLSVPELSFKNESKFNDEKENYFYNGPMAYFKKSNNDLLSLYDNKHVNQVFDKVYSEKKIDKDRKIEEAENQSQVLLALSSEVNLPNALQTYNYNPDGRCGSVAAAITLKYYDQTVNGSYVANYLENGGDYGTGSLLINYLTSYIEPATIKGSSPIELVTGINNYLTNDRRLTDSASYQSYSFTTVMSKIDQARPIILGCTAFSEFDDHWVVVHGYWGQSTSRYMIVNNGWGENDVWINADYSDAYDFTVKLKN